MLNNLEGNGEDVPPCPYNKHRGLSQPICTGECIQWVEAQFFAEGLEEEVYIYIILADNRQTVWMGF
jgi:hypothetical protein